MGMQNSAFLFHLGEAIAAVNRTILARFERNAGFFAARSAHSSEHLTGTTAGILAGIAAGLAALRLVLEAAACIKFLLTGSEHEFVAALFAYQGLVFVHVWFLHFG